MEALTISDMADSILQELDEVADGDEEPTPAPCVLVVNAIGITKRFEGIGKPQKRINQRKITNFGVNV